MSETRIVARQYNYKNGDDELGFNTITNEMFLLDTDGNTKVPNKLLVGGVNVMESIDNKSDKNHSHTEYANKQHTHTVSEITDLTNKIFDIAYPVGTVYRGKSKPTVCTWSELGYYGFKRIHSVYATNGNRYYASISLSHREITLIIHNSFNESGNPTFTYDSLSLGALNNDIRGRATICASGFNCEAESLLCYGNQNPVQITFGTDNIYCDFNRGYSDKNGRGIQCIMSFTLITELPTDWDWLVE